jgi:vacuolar iron transporter family protein
MKSSFRIGLSFGLTSGVITTLGLMVGLYAGTHSPTAVLGGIFTIAVADALSDAMGIHLAEESTKPGPVRHIWEATAATFVAKFFTALTFAVPVLLLNLQTAIWVGVLWGILLLTLLSYLIGKVQQVKPWKAIMEHLLIASCVVTASYFVGLWAKQLME